MHRVWTLTELFFGSTRGDAAGEIPMPGVTTAQLLSPGGDMPRGTVKPTSQHANSMWHLESSLVTYDCG